MTNEPEAAAGKKGGAIPVRFNDPEQAKLNRAKDLGLNQNEIIRRCVKRSINEVLKEMGVGAMELGSEAGGAHQRGEHRSAKHTSPADLQHTIKGMKSAADQAQAENRRREGEPKLKPGGTPASNRSK